MLALTGTDPDRLKEEKARGITIDLGFAHWEARGLSVAFVDVPGHERFVKNMLAGVGGIDAVLLVIAADESVMPQTREHFEICRLLQVPAGAHRPDEGRRRRTRTMIDLVARLDVARTGGRVVPRRGADDARVGADRRRPGCAAGRCGRSRAARSRHGATTGLHGCRSTACSRSRASAPS